MNVTGKVKDRRRFTAAEDEALQRMIVEGRESSEIATALGRQRESVVRRAQVIGVVIAARKPGRCPGARARAVCSRCQILLSSAPPGHDGLCGWCD